MDSPSCLSSPAACSSLLSIWSREFLSLCTTAAKVIISVVRTLPFPTTCQTAHGHGASMRHQPTTKRLLLWIFSVIAVQALSCIAPSIVPKYIKQDTVHIIRVINPASSLHQNDPFFIFDTVNYNVFSTLQSTDTEGFTFTIRQIVLHNQKILVIRSWYKNKKDPNFLDSIFKKFLNLLSTTELSRFCVILFSKLYKKYKCKYFYIYFILYFTS